MSNGLPEGFYSPRQFATIVGMSEGSVRLALREGRLSAGRDDYGRRLIAQAEITARFALELTSTVTQGATLATLRRNAAAARVELGSDEELVSSAEAYLRAVNAQPVEDALGPIQDAAAITERELVEVGAD